MQPPVGQELVEFTAFLSDMIRQGQSHLSPEEALDEWRDSVKTFSVDPTDYELIDEALRDLAKGEQPVPFADFDRHFRIKQNIESDKS
ncbi:MAG: hypothetical protein SFX18_10910 [Pirellulales bacterium]|nr:hypothetical protein [Pirellulales bacterium]